MPDRAVRRRVLSQNFLVDHRAIDALVDGAEVGRRDLVLDIGAGNGLISVALARRGACVQAIERDPALAARLRAKFATWPSVTVVEADVLAMPLPAEPFRVVANIPFGITTQILRRLLDEDGLARADMIVQAEVARKRGSRGRGTLLNACWEPWFEFGTGTRIPATAFRPRPRVDAAVLIVARRDPLLRRLYGERVDGPRDHDAAVARAGDRLAELPAHRRLRHRHGRGGAADHAAVHVFLHHKAVRRGLGMEAHQGRRAAAPGDGDAREHDEPFLNRAPPRSV